ncbi:hypothetical protein WB401_28300 [Streptomyces brasiliscabiei]|uniref:Transposase n=1 Tax=Streptomyces brasiliscabiei TaxID=2736302 RepID=A0ABU8GM09_9ACTN
MTEQEWLDNLAAQLPERNLEWVSELARICSTEWTADKPPTGETRKRVRTRAPHHDSAPSKPTNESTEFQAPSQTDGI